MWIGVLRRTKSCVRTCQDQGVFRSECRYFVKVCFEFSRGCECNIMAQFSGLSGGGVALPIGVLIIVLTMAFSPVTGQGLTTSLTSWETDTTSTSETYTCADTCAENECVGPGKDECTKCPGDDKPSCPQCDDDDLDPGDTSCTCVGECLFKEGNEEGLSLLPFLIGVGVTLLVGLVLSARSICHRTRELPSDYEATLYDGSVKMLPGPKGYGNVDNQELSPRLAEPEKEEYKDVTDKTIDEDSNLGAAGYTLITQTTQAITHMAPRNETPSHVKDVLNKFNRRTVDISANEKTDILLQLQYMAVGFFNEKGGILALQEYDVHLYIPHGAIPEGPPQQVYIYVNPDAVVADTVNGEDEQLSPGVYCGPPGLTFKDSVVLSFPHHAESSDWEFTAKMSSDSSESWQALGSSTDGQLVSAQGDKAIFLVNHFSWFALFGRSLGERRKRVRVGAFGESLGSECYSLRVYVWKDDKVSEQRVVGFEDRKRSEILDAFRDLKFLKGKGHMQVEMAEIIGWNVKPQTTRINEKDVWSNLQNSVSVFVRIEGSSSADDILHVNCFQQQEGSDRQGRKIRLHVPSQTLKTLKPHIERNNNLNQNCVARGSRDVQQVYPATCHTDGSGDNTLHKPMTEVTNTIARTIRRRPRQEVRMFGGLSDQKVNDLCECLDNPAAGYHDWSLLAYLSGNGYIPPETPKKEVLSTYFSLCSKHNIADQDAVHYLKLVFRELNCTRAAEIIEPGGERADAESIPQFLDNESLTALDAEICLRDLAKQLGPEWEELATYLGIINSELTAMRSEGSGRVNSQIFCMLVMWMQGFDSFGSDAFNTLSSNLGRVERNDLVELLKGKVTSILFFNKQNNRQL